jgi:hypothetical protein
MLAATTEIVDPFGDGRTSRVAGGIWTNVVGDKENGCCTET